ERVLEVDLRLLEGGALLPHRRLRALELRLGHPELGLRSLDRGSQRLLLRPARLHLRVGLIVHGLRGVQVAARDQLLPEEVLLAAEVAPRVEQRGVRLGGLRPGYREGGAGVVHVGAGALDLSRLVQDGGLAGLHLGLALGHGGLERGGIDAGDELAALDLGVEVREELLDLPRDLRAHLHGDDGVEVARGGDESGEGTPRHRCGTEKRGIAGALRVEMGPGQADGQEHHHYEPAQSSRHADETDPKPPMFTGYAGPRRRATVGPATARAGRSRPDSLTAPAPRWPAPGSARA